jgi:agmatine deiminase
MTIRIPAEWEPHACCWMAWAVHAEWRNHVSLVKDELSVVIRTIAQYESVRLLAPQSELAEARARFSDGNIEIIEAPVDDIWMRDIAPTFALHDGKVVAIDFNFNGWGNTKERRARTGDRLAAMAAETFGVPRLYAPFIAEGGAFITDGDGTMITTESCLLNRNRNSFGPEWIRKQKIERSFEKFGARKVIWLEGDPSEPITSGHVDGYVMFTAPGSVLVEAVEDEPCEPLQWHKHDIAILKQVKDASGCKINVEQVRAPRKKHLELRGPYWAPCYLNAYVTNGGVITALFGDTERDEAARDALERAFPERDIVMLKINHIANGGGGVHCLTQPMPIAEGIISK